MTNNPEELLKIEELFKNERNIREIFIEGTKEQVDALMALEENLKISEETRNRIKNVREEHEENHHHLGGTGIAGSGNYIVGRTPNLSETEGNND